jgi:lipopolysaccharide/colanic/teichoic acid biosynthesis glycosyltransferase/ubiquinone/menaquinone biosynthesis C-methylase UbiE
VPLPSRTTAVIQRTFDVLASAIGLAVLSPLLIGLAVTIKRTSPGPVFYRGLRAGRSGKPFRIFKFRSMVVDAERIGGPSTSDTDPRITRIGKVMRKFKLDELPQLWNVLRSEMSLVGPRPQVPDYVARYTVEEREVLAVRPGITDWASIWNSDEGAVLAQYPDPDKAYDEIIHPTKMQLQLLYVRNANLWVDAKILVYTLLRLLNRSWMPHEIRAYPQPRSSRSATAKSYESVTELPGTPANAEQLAMLYARYGWAGELVRGKEVLEVACGSGIGLGHLAAKARRIVGCDCDAKLVRIAHDAYGGAIEVQTADAHALPFADASFDVVLLFEAIYYLDQPPTFFREAHRVLRSGGTLLVCSANCERTDFNASPYSKCYFSARDLRALFQANGFDAEVLAGFAIAPQGAGDQMRAAMRTIAVKLHLIPRTMKWKARLKRLIFGRMQNLPATLGDTLPATERITTVDATASITNYKVLYAIGRRTASEQQAAA